MIQQTYSVIDANGSPVNVEIDMERQLLMVAGHPLTFENARQLAACIGNLVSANTATKAEEPSGNAVWRELTMMRLAKLEMTFEQLQELANRELRIRTAGELRADAPPRPARDRDSLLQEASERARAAGPSPSSNGNTTATPIESGSAFNMLAERGDARVMPAMPSQVRREYAGDDQAEPSDVRGPQQGQARTREMPSAVAGAVGGPTSPR